MLGMTMGVPQVPVQNERGVMVSFFGQAGKYHPRRKRLLDALQNSGLPFVSHPMPREEGLKLFARSLISFNASLNGEFNLRVFEAASTGSMILTDRITEHTGLELFFREGESMVTYGDEAELVEKAGYYLKHTDKALAIARKGAQIYQRHFTREARRDAFMRLLEGRSPPEPFLLKDEPRCWVRPASTNEQMQALVQRMALYEWVQDKHRTDETVSVDVMSANAALVVSDISDLFRVSVRLKGAACRDAGQMISALNMMKSRFVRDDPELHGASLLLADVESFDEKLVQMLADGLYGAVHVGGLNGLNGDKVAAIFRSVGMEAHAGVPNLFAKVSPAGVT
jgi:hypothetical protein